MEYLPEFPIILVTEANYQFSSNEAIGSKLKFWFDHPELGCCLYKQVKAQHIGEDWAEKVASELCKLLELPHAIYYLAETWEGNRGVVSPNFLPEGATLVHGNEILTPIVPNYPTFDTYKNTQHTIDIVMQVIISNNVGLPIHWFSINGIQTGIELFIGYLLLDAWIGNGDRHHQNWGFIRQKISSSSGETIYLAPTYDHASCLGRELSDEKRKNLSINKYANRCYSPFYHHVEDKKPLKTFDVFYKVALSYPQIAIIWLDNLANISSKNTLEIFQRIQISRISNTAVEFAQNILEFNQNRLLELRKILT